MVHARTFIGRKSLTKCDENVIAYHIVHENISAILKRQMECTKKCVNCAKTLQLKSLYHVWRWTI